MLCGALCILSFKHRVGQCIQCWVGLRLLKKAEEGHSAPLCLSLHLRQRCTVFPYHYFYPCFISCVREAIGYHSGKMSPLKVPTWKGAVRRVWLIQFLRQIHQLSRWRLNSNRKLCVSSLCWADARLLPVSQLGLLNSHFIRRPPTWADRASELLELCRARKTCYFRKPRFSFVGGRVPSFLGSSDLNWSWCLAAVRNSPPRARQRVPTSAKPSSARHCSCLLRALPEAQAWAMAISSQVLHIHKQLLLPFGTECRDQVTEHQHISIWKWVLIFFEDEVPMWFPDTQSIFYGFGVEFGSETSAGAITLLLI